MNAKYAAASILFVSAMVLIMGFDGEWRAMILGILQGLASTAFAFIALAEDMSGQSEERR